MWPWRQPAVLLHKDTTVNVYQRISFFLSSDLLEFERWSRNGAWDAMKCRSAACIAFRVPWNFLWEWIDFSSWLGLWSSHCLWEILMKSCTVAFFWLSTTQRTNGIATDKYSFHRTSFFFLFLWWIFFAKNSRRRLALRTLSITQPTAIDRPDHAPSHIVIFVKILKSTVGFYDFYHIRLRASSPDTRGIAAQRLAFGY